MGWPGPQMHPGGQLGLGVPRWACLESPASQEAISETNSQFCTLPRLPQEGCPWRGVQEGGPGMTINACLVGVVRDGANNTRKETEKPWLRGSAN